MFVVTFFIAKKFECNYNSSINKSVFYLLEPSDITGYVALTEVICTLPKGNKHTLKGA